ncbi:MAG: acetyl-CoA carboxylase carboxyltransferase subunit beta [bacterium]|nr:acetyl-CoA carboxylase carboxyltransferase subunit beta [bacterium]
MSQADSEPTSPYDSSGFAGPTKREKRDIPDGLWLKCPDCEEMLYRKTVGENNDVCPECQHHFRLSGAARILRLTDPDSFEEMFGEIAPADPLEFSWDGKTLADRISSEQAKTGQTEAVRTGVAYIKGRRIALGAMDGDWLMGSLGSAVGEKLTRLIELATEEKLPLVIVCVSGGARMHEGALSLMQMAKTSAALARYDRSGGLFISVLSDPTTGGTTASFAMLGDIIIAEPKALIGFAGQRVIANTIKSELPEGFQRAEFLLEHGFIDRIVHRGELRSELARLIDYCVR